MVNRLNSKILRDLWTLKAQTATLAVLIFCGVAVLVSSWSSYRSLKAARDDYYARHRLADVFSEFKRAPLPLLARLRDLPGVEAAEARIRESVLVDAPGQAEPATGLVLSIPDDGQSALNQVYVRQGRLPRTGGPPEVLVHEAFAAAHGLKPGDGLRAQFGGRVERLRVAGVGLSPEFVYALNPSAPFPDNKHFAVLWMPRSSLAPLARMEDSFNSLILRLAAGAGRAEVISLVDPIIKPYGGLGAQGRDKQLSPLLVDDEIRQQRIMAVFNPSIFLAVAAFLIHIVISRLVDLQRPHIATLKSLGYWDRDIAFHYMKLACLMCLCGALPGIGAGAWLGRFYSDMYQDFFRFPSLDFAVSGSAAALGLVAGVAPGLLGAWLSARTIFRLSPAEALAPPAPPAFHAGFWEKALMGGGLDERDRLVLRRLFFRPGRLALVVLGMASSAAILVNTGFWTDTLDYVIDAQFRRLNREDVSVAFHHPRAREALNALARLPGVLAVEGLRTAPVRLRFQNRSRETVVVGLSEDASLRRTLDAEGRRVVAPSHGVLVSEAFKGPLGLAVGDRLELEVLEGGRRRWTPEVAGFVEDLVGNGVYMDKPALHRALGEGVVYNQVLLRADPRALSRLSVELKRMPAVAAVNVKTLLYQGFQETMAGMVKFFSAVLFAFALSIAAAVIFNSARVIFSERAWELASLQILGFGRGTLWSLLFAEIAAQALLALAPGLALGVFFSWLSARMVHSESFQFPFHLEASTLAASGVSLLGLLFLGGGILHLLLSRLDLAEALKARE